MTYRNPKLLQAVRQLPCANCGAEDGTVCAAHSNSLADGKGRSMKAADYRVAALCFRCHMELDQGTKLSKDERRELFESAHRATIGQLFERGILQVKG